MKRLRDELIDVAVPLVLLAMLMGMLAFVVVVAYLSERDRASACLEAAKVAQPGVVVFCD